MGIAGVKGKQYLCTSFLNNNVSMKKYFTSLCLLLTAMATMAQGHSPASQMRFAGKANIQVASTMIPVVSDTIRYQGSSITLPKLTFGDKVIPSFTIEGVKFEMDMQTMTVTFNANQEYSVTVKVGNEEKTITGTLVSGRFVHAPYNQLDLTTTFTYPGMPMPLTYSIEGYYIKDYTQKMDVTIGATYNYTVPSATFSVRTYPDAEKTLLDIDVPAYQLSETPMGNLSIGAYTVKGLAMNDEKGGYYRDYAADGLQMHFKAETNGKTTFDQDYTMSNGQNDILAVIEGSNISIKNTFAPGNMPFPISNIFPGVTEASVKTVKSAKADGQAAYNMAGQRIGSGYKGLVVKNGRKYVQK